MKIEFTREERIVNALMLHATSLDDIGLLHGKMGVALYFHRLARHTGKEAFGTFADELIDQTIEGLHAGLPVGFERGIAGIGWAVEQLIRGGFVEADADEVLEELDGRAMQALIHQENDLKTVASLGYYMASRVAYRMADEATPIVLHLKHHLILLVDELERFVDRGERVDELPHLLEELHRLNLFPYKVEKLQSIVGPSQTAYILPFMPKRTLDEKDIKSRYAGYDLDRVPEAERWGLLGGVAGIGLQKLCAHEGL